MDKTTTEKISGTICDAWEKENTTGNMQYYVKLDNDVIYSKWGNLPKDIVIGAKIELEYTTSGKYRNIVSYTILAKAEPIPRSTVKLPPQKTLDDVTLRDIYEKISAVELAVAKLGVKD